MELAQGGAGRCGAWIVDVLLNLLNLCYTLGFHTYASAILWNYDYVLNTYRINWLVYITFTIYIVLYDWWLDPGQSRSQAVILHRWILGVWQIGIGAIGYRELGFNMVKTFLLKPDYKQNSALNDPQQRFAPRARLNILGNMVYVYYLLARIT